MLALFRPAGENLSSRVRSQSRSIDARLGAARGAYLRARGPADAALDLTAETAEPDERDAEIARLRAENARLRAGREGSEPPTPPPFRQVDAASQASPEDLMRFSPRTEDEGVEETKAGPIESESYSDFDSDSQPLLGGSPS